jgi:hypothetical protein
MCEPVVSVVNSGAFLNFSPCKEIKKIKNK